MKKFIAAMVSILVFGVVGMAGAWSIDEYSEGDSDYTHVWFDIINDSNESMLGFGVGISFDLDWGGDDERYTEHRAPSHYTGSPVGDWYSYIINQNQWDDDFNDFVGPGGDTTFKAYFGTSWGETFGTYEYAYVAAPQHSYSNDPGYIPANYVYEDRGFFYDVYAAGVPASPAIALFDSGSIIGETNFGNNNPGAPAPVPEPATMLLFGTGLAGLIAARRKKSVKA